MKQVYKEVHGVIVLDNDVKHEYYWNVDCHFAVKSGVSFENAGHMLDLLCAKLSIIDKVVEEEQSETVTISSKPPKTTKPRKRKERVAKTPKKEVVAEPVKTPEMAETVAAEPTVVEPVVSETKQQTGNGVPDNVRNSRQLKTIVKYFITQGADDADAILIKCNEYKTDIPVLAKATNLQRRVERIAEVLLTN